MRIAWSSWPPAGFWFLSSLLDFCFDCCPEACTSDLSGNIRDNAEIATAEIKRIFACFIFSLLPLEHSTRGDGLCGFRGGPSPELRSCETPHHGWTRSGNMPPGTGS